MNIRSRRRGSGVRSAAAAAAAAAVVLVCTVTGVGATADAGPGGHVPLEERHLPTAVNAPGTWSDREGVRGPVAAVGLATRTHARGIFGAPGSLAFFAVSATDGSASWLPRLTTTGAGGFALSPDGEWIGWARRQSSGRFGSERVVGWSVMNTTTGEVQQLAVPGFSWVRGMLAELAFSGDSRYLLTSYETPGRRQRSGTRAHQLVAWDVEDGTRTVLEERGPDSEALLGSAPTGVVWARGRQVFRVHPGAAVTTAVTLPHDVFDASWGPDDTSFAYIAGPSRTQTAPQGLYAGRTLAEARQHPIDVPRVDVAEIVGWRDATHVVVGHYRESVDVVDVVTGEVESIDLDGHGQPFNAPQLASALWQQPLVPPVPVTGTADPRRPWRWLSGAFLVVASGLLVGLVRRRRAGSGGFAAVLDRHDLALPPLATAASGLVVVLLDFRVQGFDLIPDPLGWVMAARALTSLQAVHRGFRAAGVAAWLAVVPGVADWLGVKGRLLDLPLAVALLVVEVAVCTALMATSPRHRSSASAIRWLTLALGAALALTIVAATAEPSAGVLVLAVGLTDLVVTMWFVVLLYGAAREAPPQVGQLQHV